MDSNDSTAAAEPPSFLAGGLVVLAIVYGGFALFMFNWAASEPWHSYDADATTWRLLAWVGTSAALVAAGGAAVLWTSRRGRTTWPSVLLLGFSGQLLGASAAVFVWSLDQPFADLWDVNWPYDATSAAWALACIVGGVAGSGVGMGVARFGRRRSTQRATAQ